MADIITRLVMKSDAFDANLKRAKGSVNSFQSDISSMAKTAGAGVLKFAGTLGIAVGAGEALMKTIKSSQTTGDAFTKRMDEAKAGVDSFFASVAMGNMGDFLSNLQNVIDKAGELSDALDNLGTKTLFSNSTIDDLNTEYQLEINRAKARNLSDEERNKHLEKAKALLIEMTGVQRSLGKENTDTSYVTLQADLAKQGFDRNVSREVWDYLMDSRNRPDIDKKANRYNNTVKGYEDQLAHTYNPKTGTWLTQTEANEIKRELSEYKSSKSGGFDRLASVFVQLADDEKSAIANAMKMRATANALSVSISQKELEIANTDARINGTHNKKKDKKDTPLEGTLAWYDAEISHLNKKLSEETTMQARAAVQAEINELERQKIHLKIVVDQEAFKIKHGEMKGSKVDDIGYSEQYNMFSEMLSEREYALSKATDERSKASIQSQIDKLQETIKELNKARYELEHTPIGDVYGALRGNAGSKKQGSFDLRKEIGNMKLPKFKSPIKKKDIDLNEEYAKSLGLIGSVMGNLSGVTNDSASAYLQWGANVLSSISMAIPLIAKLTTAKTAEAAAEAASSAAKVPFVGWMAAAGAALSVVATMASIPKFANGGIVPGISFSGDRVPAMVNSGEMILNGSQQANLFKILNSKLYSGLDVSRPNISPIPGHLAGLISPSPNGQKVEVSGNFKVRGQDLELVLNNRSRIKNKIR